MPPSTPANLGAVALVSVTLCSVYTRKLVMIADERFVFGRHVSMYRQPCLSTAIPPHSRRTTDMTQTQQHLGDTSASGSQHNVAATTTVA